MQNLFKFKDKELFYKTYGEGPPILFIHGIFMDHKRFENIAKDLMNAGFQVIAVDLPSHGNSTVRTFSTKSLIEILKALMSDLNHESYFSVGVSLGASISSELAVSDNRVKKSVSIFPVTSKQTSTQFLLGCTSDLVKKLNLTPRSFFHKIYRKNTSPEFSEDVIQERIDGIFSQSSNGIISDIVWGSQINSGKNLQKLGNTCLTIAGDKDKLAPKEHLQQICQNLIVIDSNHSDLEPAKLFEKGEHIIARFFQDN